MADFFETGPGRTALGDSAAVAVEASRHLEREIAEVAAFTTTSGDVSGVREAVKKWAAEHPIRHAIQDHESTLGRALERDYAESWSPGESAAWIAVSLDDLNRRLEVYSSQLVRQARWEGELLASDPRLAEAVPLAERAVSSAEKASATLDRVAPQVERTLGVAEGAPALIASERKAALDSLAADLARTIVFLQQERINGFQQLTRERMEALSDLERSVSQERRAFDRDLERAAREMVDRAFWRLAQLVAATLAALVILTAAGLLLVKKLLLAAASA